MAGEGILRQNSLAQQRNERWQVENLRVLRNNIFQQSIQQLRSVLHRHIWIGDESREGGKDFGEHRNDRLSGDFDDVVETLAGEVADSRVGVLDADKKFRVFENVEVTFDGKIVILEWEANPVNDMFADTILASLLQTELCGSQIKGPAKSTKSDQAHLRDCIMETLQVWTARTFPNIFNLNFHPQDMFGEDAIPKTFKGDLLQMTVNGKTVDIDLASLEVTCLEDEILRDMVYTAINKLNQVLVDPK